jgi:hypothetical protein
MPGGVGGGRFSVPPIPIDVLYPIICENLDLKSFGRTYMYIMTPLKKGP